MKLKVHAIYDEKSEAYLQPFFVLTNAEAIRIFQGELVSETSLICQHPQDFTLYQLAEYDNNSGEITNKKIDLGNGINYKKKAVEQIENNDSQMKLELVKEN